MELDVRLMKLKHQILSNTVKNNQKEILNQFSFDQKNEIIRFCNGDIK
jgi:hypothetical protein